MKAYVIKNKEGKYRDKDGWLNDEFSEVDIYKDYELALSACFSDEKPVEITLAEGNLEKSAKKFVSKLKNLLTQFFAEIEDIIDKIEGEEE